MLLKEFQLVGGGLFAAGLNNSHSGNLSVRAGKKIIITRRGSMLGHLTEKDLIETDLLKDGPEHNLVSREIGVHRAVYLHTSAQALVHAHPIFATALSLVEDEIEPIDAEGKYYLKKVPVLTVRETIGSAEVAEKLPLLLRENKIVVVKGHGTFAGGKTLEEAYQWTTSLEHACKILYYTRTLRAR
ncbi:class II aldolase/adducin family protein [Thermincola ferriacetica]|uniref:Class II aldolase/adducin family protein n=1 Tax=Thermincola ferriacetica TaxID=281456 RepID=A0A0L6W250_9FIRM|nr:aldolase [Thermincola ferriacetica]KNZ69620.1 class II aldolase/adducin family protein [Thermincola ferriacetica]